VASFNSKTNCYKFIQLIIGCTIQVPRIRPLADIVHYKYIFTYLFTYKNNILDLNSIKSLQK